MLQINFRGSGGYGNAFESKGYRNWGTTMINDMTDAVDWVIAQGIADPDVEKALVGMGDRLRCAGGP